MKNIIMICLSLLSLQSYAQKEAWHWYFGRNVGLDFSQTRILNSSLGPIDNVPTVVKGPISTFEGCFSISDSEGNFLLASDGMTVYNKNQAVMKNGTGLLGDPSSTNSGIVIPVPNNKNLYYIFTAPDRDATASGLRYSLVDMSRDNGLGEIVEKNISLPFGSSGYPITYAYENLTAVGHSNGKDFWLVTRVRSKMFSWLVTSTGVDTNPVISEIGMDLGLPGNGTGVGAIKISPDGKRIVHADYTFNSLHYLTIGDFDTSTGKAYNFSFVPTKLERLYGVEFSSSGNYIYITAIERADTGLYIKSMDNVSAPFTRVLSNITNVQLGPDNRIYAIGNLKTSLWVILDPDNGGTQIAEFPNVFTAPNLPYLGLPPFITSFFTLKPIVGKSIVCLGNVAEYSIEILNIGSGPQRIDYLVWNFGDGSPVIIDNSISASKTIYKQQHDYSSKGEYLISVTPYLANGLPDNTKINTIKATVSECKIVTNKMIRHDILP